MSIGVKGRQKASGSWRKVLNLANDNRKLRNFRRLAGGVERYTFCATSHANPSYPLAFLSCDRDWI